MGATSPAQHPPGLLQNKHKHHIKTQGAISGEDNATLLANSLLKAKMGIAVAFLSRQALFKGGRKRSSMPKRR